MGRLEKLSWMRERLGLRGVSERSRRVAGGGEGIVRSKSGGEES